MDRYWLLGLRCCALLAVAFSCALLLHYLSPAEQAFCGAQSDCDVVRKSALLAWGPRGLLPGLGVAGYTGLFWLTFHARARRFVTIVALIGAACALGLFVYQALWLKAFCWLCVTVDVAALFTFAFALLWRNVHDSGKVQQESGVRGWAWFALLAISLNAPNVWLAVRPVATLPSAIEELQRDDVVTVVEFADFECPHCRRMHDSLRVAFELVPTPYRLVRFHVPLKFHIFAERAARAAICAEGFGLADAMANRLFTGRVEPDALFLHAAALGIPDAAFRACLDAETTSNTLTVHRAVFDSVGGKGVPLTFIGTERVDGATGPNVVAQAMHRASQPSGFTGLPAWAFAAILLAVVAAIATVGRG
jgi:protein-disulfide isomerase